MEEENLTKNLSMETMLVYKGCVGRETQLKQSKRPGIGIKQCKMTA